jgi:hypothetical protein
MEFGPTTAKGRRDKAMQVLRQGNTTAAPDSSDCVVYTTKKKMRLVKLHALLFTLSTTLAAPGATGAAAADTVKILADLLASSSGYVNDTAAANTTFKVYGSARDVLVAALNDNSTDPQLDALLRIKQYNDTGGVLKEWSSGTGANGAYCSWTGISCTDGKVTEIDIWSGKGITDLKGKLPPAGAFSGLDSLVEVTISDQPGITDTLPDDWARLQQLRHVSVANNSLIGTIPESWGSLKGLTKLWLFRNILTGSLPGSFSALTAMQDIGLNLNF